MITLKDFTAKEVGKVRDKIVFDYYTSVKEGLPDDEVRQSDLGHLTRIVVECIAQGTNVDTPQELCQALCGLKPEE